VETDIVVVGAGPTGLYASYYAGFRGLRTVVIDSLPEAGGQVTAMYPEKLIHDVAGFPAIRGRELVASLVEQANAFAPTWLLGRSATQLSRLDDGRIRLTTSMGDEVITGSIVIAGGIGTFTPRPLPVGAQFVGRGVEHFVTDPGDYVGQHVLIVGGGDSAVDWALMLGPIAESVTIAHRRAGFRAHKASLDALAGTSAVVRTPFVLDDLAGADRIERAVLRNVETGALVDVPCTRVVAALGFIAQLGPLTQWGLAIVDRHIVVDSTMFTGVAGIYAAGDITEYVGKVRLISVGFGEAALAVNNAVVASDPSQRLFPGHSTEAAA
jgi:thioredoxin reductase